MYRFSTPFLHTEDEEPINLYDFIKIAKSLNYNLEIIFQEALSPLLFPLNVLSKLLNKNLQNYYASLIINSQIFIYLNPYQE